MPPCAKFELAIRLLSSSSLDEFDCRPYGITWLFFPFWCEISWCFPVWLNLICLADSWFMLKPSDKSPSMLF